MIYLAIDRADQKTGEPLGAGFARWLWSYVDAAPIINRAVWSNTSKTPTVSEVSGHLPEPALGLRIVDAIVKS